MLIFLDPHSCLYSKLLSVVSSFNLTQIVSEPTRVTESSSTLIDLIFVIPTVIVKYCSTLPPLANADHYGLQLIMTTKSPVKRSKPVSRRIWRYTLADFNRAAELLDTIEWTNLLPDNVDDFWSAWKTYFLQIMEICIPNANVKVKKNIPWMNKGISVAIKQRNKLFQVAKRTGKSSDRIKYNLKRNHVVAMLRQSKQSFFNRLNDADSKTFWRTVRLLNHQQTSLPTLHHNGTAIELSESKADALNNFFYNCFNHRFPPLASSDSEYAYKELLSQDCPQHLLCTEDTIFDLLVALDTSKSTGCDGISGKMLKSTADSITPTLTALFNMSISSGKIPKEWKMGRIAPVPKGTDRTSLSGYRPISILPVISKVIERHVKSIIETHLQHNAPISDRQWGFMSSRSTMSALIKVVDDCSQALDQGHELCAVFFDVRKAFDTVPHLPLLQTLDKLGLNKYLLRWIRNYLFQRAQYVAIDGCESQSLPVVSGVPQGSVLGPLLFICYINDVTAVISSGSEINLFADDIVLYRIITSPSDFVHLQQDIDSLSSCVTDKQLQFNATKCRQMLISRKRAHSSTPPNLYVSGTALLQVSEYKYLGVVITSDLSWRPHITNMCNKTRKLIGLLYRRFYQSSNSSILLKLYLSFVRPHLEFSSAVWSPHLKGEVEAVEKVQKYALKVCMKSWDTSYADLLSMTSLPSMQCRRLQTSLCHLYKIVHGLTDFPGAPTTRQQFHYNSRSSTTEALVVPHFRTSSHQNSFFPLTICEWNKLPKEIIECKTLCSFKKFLSKHYV